VGGIAIRSKKRNYDFEEHRYEERVAICGHFRSAGRKKMF